MTGSVSQPLPGAEKRRPKRPARCGLAEDATAIVS